MKISKQKLPFVIVMASIIIIVLLMGGTCTWVAKQNKEIKKGSLADAKRVDDRFILDDFEIQIKTRGGDSGSWIKDPIYDEAGNELHGSSVGTIYEIIVSNTSNAILADWKLELFMPEYLWLNNVWNGHMEIRQTTSGALIAQEVDLGEYTKTDIVLDYYVDHTGPMVSMNPGDSFVYIPSEADNEKPLISANTEGSGKSYALIGFITYVPDQTIDYIVPFTEGVIEYNLKITVWDVPFLWLC